MKEYQSLKIKNYMEDVVSQNIDEVLKGYDDVCKCEHCRCDIMAIVLNDLPPRYVVTALGETYTKIQMLTQQFKVDLITAISKAVNVVRNKPRHDHNHE